MILPKYYYLKTDFSAFFKKLYGSYCRPISLTVLTRNDLKPGMELKGTVRNIVDFGAFVDIGVHQDGLVHISELSDRYVKHPLDVVKVGDIVNVKVLSIDEKRGKIALSMRGAGK